MESKAKVGDVVVVSSDANIGGVPAILTQDMIDSGTNYWVPNKEDLYIWWRNADAELKELKGVHSGELLEKAKAISILCRISRKALSVTAGHNLFNKIENLIETL